MMMPKLLVTALALCLLGAVAEAADDISTAHLEDNAMANAEEIISMRSTLARTFIRPGAEVNEETFKKVCGAVGKRVKEITEKEGVRIRHAATKFRNPANEATAEEAALIARFSSAGAPKEVWDHIELDGRRHRRYTRPIYVEEACLACHGSKDTRPAFIAEKYPLDMAFDFKKGDLRGIISVMFTVDPN